MKIAYTVGLITIVGLSVGIGYSIGSISSSSPIQVTPSTKPMNDSMPTSIKKETSSENVVVSQKKQTVESTPTTTFSSSPESEAIQRDSDLVMSEGISELMVLTFSDGNVDYKRVNDIKKQLLVLARNDREALTTLVTAYRESSSNKMVQEQLLQIVSQIKDVEVENSALALASSSNKDDQLAGLELLGELKIPNDKTVSVIESTLTQNQDDEKLVLAALHALPNMRLSSSQNEGLIDELNQLVMSESEAIRSESIIALGQFAKDETQMEAVLLALNSSVVDDKISAAMALEQSHITGDHIKDVLMTKMQESSELWEVRAMSANALERFNLDDYEYSLLADFRRHQSAGNN